MKQTRVLQEIRLMKFTEVYEWWSESKITQTEAASLLGMCERTFRRYCRKQESDEVQALYDKRLDKAAHNAAPVDKVAEPTKPFEAQRHSPSEVYSCDEWRAQYIRATSSVPASAWHPHKQGALFLP